MFVCTRQGTYHTVKNGAWKGVSKNKEKDISYLKASSGNGPIRALNSNPTILLGCCPGVIRGGGLACKQSPQRGWEKFVKIKSPQFGRFMSGGESPVMNSG